MSLLNLSSLEGFSNILPQMNQSDSNQIAPSNNSLNLTQPNSNQSTQDISGDIKTIQSSNGHSIFKDQNFLDLIKSPLQGNFKFTSGVGEREVPTGTANINKTSNGHQFHAGVDLAATKDTPIVPTITGTIVDFGDKKDGYGNQILMKSQTPDGQTFYQRFGHLDFISKDVKKGMLTGPNTQLGGVGTTGNSTGNHLHYEVFRVDDKKQKDYLDMNDLFKNMK